MYIEETASINPIHDGQVLVESGFGIGCISRKLDENIINNLYSPSLFVLYKYVRCIDGDDEAIFVGEIILRTAGLN